MNTFKNVIIYHKRLTPYKIEWTASVHSVMTSFFSCMMIDNLNNDMLYDNMRLRIRTSESICKVGDRVEFGDVPKDTPDENSFEIVSVTENFRGSPSMHHVKITAR